MDGKRCRQVEKGGREGNKESKGEREKRGRKKGGEEGKRKVEEGGDGFGRIGRELGDDREKEGCWYDIFHQGVSSTGHFVMYRSLGQEWTLMRLA